MKTFFQGRVLMVILIVAFAMVPLGVNAQGVLAPRGESNERDPVKDSDESHGASADDIGLGDFDDGLPIPVLFGAPYALQYSTFGDPRGGGTREHEGFDILVPEGTPIVSPTEAEVRRIGQFRGAGHYVITEDDDYRYYYYHLQEQPDHIERGDDLDVGDFVGFVGHSGNAIASAPHLHLEIRDGRKALDPYPFFSRDFTLTQKMQILEGVFDEVRDEEELAKFLVENFIETFREAELQGIEIPREVMRELPGNFEATASVPSRNLTIGDRGSGVSALQRVLITEGYLNIAVPTEYFGPLTQRALASYQRANGISPASGYYGPITRSHLASADGGSGSTRTNELDNVSELSEAELLERIAELTALVESLRSQMGK